MKESRFLELLNLYIDQEITPDEAALLEQEILRSSDRRKIYVQYCRMHRASTVLFDRYRSGNAPSGDKLAQAARDADEKVLEFPAVAPRKSVRTWGYAVGTLAAAACLTLVVVNRDFQTAPTHSDPVAMEAQRQTSARPLGAADAGSTPMTTVLVASKSSAAAPTNSNTEMNSYQSAFVVKPLGQDSYPNFGNADFQQNQQLAAWDWMRRLQMTPVRIVPAADLIFESKPALQQDPRTFRSLRPIPATIEMTAFQFQK